MAKSKYKNIDNYLRDYLTDARVTAGDVPDVYMTLGSLLWLADIEDDEIISDILDNTHVSVQGLRKLIKEAKQEINS